VIYTLPKNKTVAIYFMEKCARSQIHKMAMNCQVVFQSWTNIHAVVLS